MIVYYLMTAVMLISGIALDRSKFKCKRGIYCFFAGVVLFAVAGLRHSVGFDYNLYANWYFSFNFMSMDDVIVNRLEKGYIVPLKYLTELIVDYKFFIIVIALLITVGIMLYIYFYSEKPYISVAAFMFFGMFFNSLNFMRQFMAAIIVAYAFKYVKEKNFLRFLLLVIAASTLHISALIMIPIYFLLKIKMNWISLSIYGVSFITAFIFAEEILAFVTKFYYKGRGFTNPGLSPWYTVMFFALFIICFLLRNKLTERNSYNNALLNMLLFTVLAEFIGMQYSIVSRFALIFYIPPILLLTPQVIQIVAGMLRKKFGINRQKKAIASSVGYISFLIVGVIIFQFLLSRNYNGVLPYKTIFDNPAIEVEKDFDENSSVVKTDN